ncbi:MAG: Stage V sporulation protein D [bacterium ADurb.Bin212]|nr:MAG: Stage V sporulation protein D [bacterium ADurb.Bin212]
MRLDKQTESRFKIAGIMVILLMGIIVARMFEKQVLQHGKYIALAEEQQRFEKTEIAERGRIYAHDQIEEEGSLYPLAFDIKTYQLWAVPKQIKDKQKTAETLSLITGMSFEDIFSQIDNDKLYIPPVKKGVDYDTAQKLKAEKLSGIMLVPENSRYYPEFSLASHLLGFVNAEGKGNYGFEGHYNKELVGTSGKMVGEKDTLGRVISLIDEKSPQDGTSYVLTVDRSVQYFVEKKLSEAIEKYQADSGTIIVMDIETGGILAMSSKPDYDVNNYRAIAKDNPSLFVNPAIAHLYEPGSIFKPFVMAAAIDKGLINPETEGVFDWHVWVDNYEIKTAERKAFGKENMTQVLQNSDNVAMVWISELLGKEGMYEYIKNFNFFDKTGIDLDTEVSGYTKPVKEWKNINRATISFGQGIAVTPMQIVSAYATMANGGVYLYPRVVDKIIMPNGQEKKIEKKEGVRVIKENTAKIMAKMLKEVVEGGHSWRAKVEGFSIGAKTGTAQIPKKEGGYEENESGLGVFIHSLAGFAPTENPKYAMLVKLDRPKSAKYSENTAAPLFGEISSFLLNFYYRLPANK